MWWNDIRDFFIALLACLIFAAALGAIANVGFGLKIM
jgi:hypothetical protein